MDPITLICGISSECGLEGYILVDHYQTSTDFIKVIPKFLKMTTKFDLFMDNASIHKSKISYEAN